MLFSFAGCDLESYEYDSNSSTISSTSETSNPSSTSEDSKSEQSSQLSDTSSTQTQKPSSVGSGTATAVKPSSIPKYSGEAFVVVNNNQPNFSASELTTTGYEKYSSRDSLGRCGVAIASCGKEIMPRPDEKRGSISSITPTGWIQKSYSGISGGYLWNRCHLIGWQLSAENANRENLITGTRYMNINGMLPFENMVADYIKETGNHVAYRITPIFEGNNLVCSGVQMEAYSVEDDGDGICFNVYCYNVQPDIIIDYATGASRLAEDEPEAETIPPIEPDESISQGIYRTPSGKRYHIDAECGGKNSYPVSMEEALGAGLTPCSKCAK